MKRTNEKGITLISLIITIVVIVILLGVTELAISDDLFGKADNVEKYTVAAINDAHNDIENIKNQPIINDVIITDDLNEITVTSEVSNRTQTSAKITATAQDKKGERLTYRLIINETSKTYGPTISDTESASWDVTGLTPNTKYTYKVTVVDEEGNQGYCNNEFTTLPLHPPVITVNELNDKTTESFTIDVNAIDEDNDELIYKIYIKSYNDIRYLTYKPIKTTEKTQQGEPIQLEIEGLKEYTLYYWYITVEDENATITSGEQSVRTYCHGGDDCTYAKKCSDGYSYELELCEGAELEFYSLAAGENGQFATIDPPYDACPVTGYTDLSPLMAVLEVYCPVCKRSGILYECSCSGDTETGDSNSHLICDDDGWRSEFHTGTYMVECTHGLSKEHYYCISCGIYDLETAEHKKKCTHDSYEMHD